MKAKLHIQTAHREDRTVLKKAFFTPPFKVANVTEDKRSNLLKLMLMSSSPGILEGDVYQIQVDVAENCALELQTQSYQRLFSMKLGASQQTQIRLAANSAFCYLPHPTVPHEASRFSAINRIDMTDSSSLIWGEVLTCGRKLNGEVFHFSRYHNLTQVWLNQRLVVKENLLVEPDRMNVQAIGQMEGFTHQANLLYLHQQAPVSTLSNTLHDYLNQQSDVLFGVTAAPVNGLVIRLLGHRAEQLHTCLKTIANLLPQPKAVTNAA
ncbi:urease accessory protein UreD [Spirosoma sp. SC4-14]|uniref:urease accessory protein UreD n=1 Tax=Spirosoma sp. SC4-14 TaxID=3128900 RepID=UPI0030D5A8F6